MKKVLFFIESLAGGGAEKVLSTIVKHLDKQNYSITVMTVTKTGVYVEEVEKYAKIISLLPHYSPTSNILDRIKYHLAYKEIYHSSPERIYKKYVKDLYDVEIAFVEGFATKFIAASTNPNSRKICWVHIDMEKNPYADHSYDSIAEERETNLIYMIVFQLFTTRLIVKKYGKRQLTVLWCWRKGRSTSLPLED